MSWIKKHLKVSSPLKQEKKNELSLDGNRSTTQSDTNPNQKITTLSGGLNLTRGMSSIYARGDTDKNFSTGISTRSKSGNFSAGLNYNKTNFGSNIGANVKLKF